jgi:hypothetical protein
MRARAARILSSLAAGRRFLGTLLRELADENAYARHLARRGAAPSPDEWRRFSAERMRARYARAKCC